MRNTPQEIVISLIAGSFLLLVLGTVVVFALIVNNKRKMRHARELMVVQDSLLKSIARELHDNVGLLVSMARLNLQLAAKSPENAPGYYQETDTFLSGTLTALRGVVAIIHSEHSFLHGMQNAIDGELESMRKTGAYQVNFDPDPTEKKMSSDAQIQILRIVQECLHNIIKHSNATRIDIRARYNESAFELSICDNGIGFEMQAQKETNGIGLDNISRRAKYMYGNVTIDSARGKGTCILLTVPYKDNL